MLKWLDIDCVPKWFKAYTFCQFWRVRRRSIGKVLYMFLERSLGYDNWGGGGGRYIVTKPS